MQYLIIWEVISFLILVFFFVFCFFFVFFVYSKFLYERVYCYHDQTHSYRWGSHILHCRKLSFENTIYVVKSRCWIFPARCLVFLNTFLTNILILHPLKTPANLWCKIGKLARNGLSEIKYLDITANFFLILTIFSSTKWALE